MGQDTVIENLLSLHNDLSNVNCKVARAWMSEWLRRQTRTLCSMLGTRHLLGFACAGSNPVPRAFPVIPELDVASCCCFDLVAVSHFCYCLCPFSQGLVAGAVLQRGFVVERMAWAFFVLAHLMGALGALLFAVSLACSGEMA